MTDKHEPHSPELAELAATPFERALAAKLLALETMVERAVALGCPVCAPSAIAAAHPETVPTRATALVDLNPTIGQLNGTAAPASNGRGRTTSP